MRSRRHCPTISRADRAVAPGTGPESSYAELPFSFIMRFPAHRLDHAGGIEQLAVAAGGVLAVGMVDEPATRALPLDRHGERRDRQFLTQVIAHRLAHLTTLAAPCQEVVGVSVAPESWIASCSGCRASSRTSRRKRRHRCLPTTSHQPTQSRSLRRPTQLPSILRDAYASGRLPMSRSMSRSTGPTILAILA